MTSDSDSEFVDVFEPSWPVQEDEVPVAQTSRNGKKVRGEDINWVEAYRFVNAKEYHASDIAKKLWDEFSARKRENFLMLKWKFSTVNTPEKLGICHVLGK